VARQRGEAIKQDLLADPEMLSTAAIAERLGKFSAANSPKSFPAWRVCSPFWVTILGACSDSCNSAAAS
jgi:hypothetical protein